MWGGVEGGVAMVAMALIRGRAVRWIEWLVGGPRWIFGVGES